MPAENALADGMRFTFEKSRMNADRVGPYTQAFCAAVDAGVAGLPHDELRQLDPNIGEPGGYAFLWEDVFGFSEIADALLEFEASPNELGAMAWKLFTVWQRMRSARVAINENEFRVLKAVRSGHHEPAAIASYAELPLDVAQTTIRGLKERRYKKDIALMDDDGTRLTTQF